MAVFANIYHSDRTARLWSTERIYPLRVFAGHISDVDVVEFHPNCNYIATGSSDKSVRLWDIQTGDCVRVLTGHTGGITCAAFSPDGRVLVTSGEDCRIIVWDLATGKVMEELEGHTAPVRSLSISQEGSVLASGSMDQTVKVWNVKQLIDTADQVSSRRGSCIMETFHTKSTPVTFLKFSPRNLLLGAGPFTASP